jgi:ATP-dependent Lon protease
MESPSLIPLFPLGLVLMPYEQLPLHIFEERYKTMIAECLKNNKPFGIVFFEGNDFRHAGCTARITEVLKRYENGEMDIMTKGEMRFTINRLYDSAPYLEADVRYYDDAPEDKNADLLHFAKEGLEVLKDLNAIQGKPQDMDKLKDMGLKRISFIISQNEGFTPAEKQKFLEMTSTKKRLESSIKSLQAVLQRAVLTLKIQKIIGGNGNIQKILNNYGD